MRGIVVIYFLLLILSCMSVQAEDKTVAVIESMYHSNHANNVVDIIGKKHVKLYLTDLNDNKKYFKTLTAVADGNEKIVNMSIQGCNPIEFERQAIKRMVDRGKIVVVSAGNKDRQYAHCTIYPANYKIKGMIVVASIHGHQKSADVVMSNDEHCIRFGGCLRGSSQAAAKMSKIILKKYLKGRSIASIKKQYDKE